MSTNPKDLNPKQNSEATIAKSRKVVDRSLRALMQEMEHENTLIQESPTARLQKVLKIFRGTKPLFAVLSSLPLLPTTWRASIVMLTQALDALAVAAPAVTGAFKAGKDL
ncbi:MAG TPA: hypothetical protein VE974_29660 [Thermoanaerobaculia bacterium]|nr:hypothetical protein [Thermoanaerobaculia bacterium]